MIIQQKNISYYVIYKPRCHIVSQLQYSVSCYLGIRPSGNSPVRKAPLIYKGNPRNLKKYKYVWMKK